MGVLLSACTGAPPLANTQNSPAALAAAVLDALAANDRMRLEALALNETEFRDHVWPRLPASREERNLPFSYVWGDLRQKSRESLTKTLHEHGGRRYKLVDVIFNGETGYGDFVVHRDAAFVVTDAAGERPIRVSGSMIEQDGGWKVFSYVVDD